MDPFRLRAAAAGALIALCAGLLAASPAFDGLRGLSVDLLTMLRWHLHSATCTRRRPRKRFVVALDEETFRTPPFEGTPSVTWTPEIGRVLDAVIDGGAKVVGFDVVFPTSIEQSAVRFGDETLSRHTPARLRPRLSARARARRTRRQGRARRSPASGPAGAPLAGPTHRRRLRAQHPGAERVQRPGRRDPARAARVHGRRRPGPLDGGGARGARRRHAAVGDARHRGCRRGARSRSTSRPAPTTSPPFSLADLRACVEKGDKDFFRRHFAGKRPC